MALAVAWMLLAVALPDNEPTTPRVVSFHEPEMLLPSLVMSLAAPGFDWPRDMPWTHLGLIVLGGLLGTFGHFLFILAFRHAPASSITPFTYMQLVWATLAGWVFYRHLPDAPAVAGMMVIAGSGLTVALLDRRRARQLALDPLTVA